MKTVCQVKGYAFQFTGALPLIFAALFGLEIARKEEKQKRKLGFSVFGSRDVVETISQIQAVNKRIVYCLKDFEASCDCKSL